MGHWLQFAYPQPNKPISDQKKDFTLVLNFPMYSRKRSKTRRSNRGKYKTCNEFHGSVRRCIYVFMNMGEKLSLCHLFLGDGKEKAKNGYKLESAPLK